MKNININIDRLSAQTLMTSSPPRLECAAILADSVIGNISITQVTEAAGITRGRFIVVFGGGGGGASRCS
jgi:hypothetical protein